MSPLVKQMFNGGWPDKAAVEQLNKDRLYYDAIEAYRVTLPALNTIGMRDGSEAKFGKGYNVLPIWKERMNAKSWVPTPNCDVIYSMSYLDLKETGPLVVYAPGKSLACSRTSSSGRSPTSGPSDRIAPAVGSICCCRRITRARAGGLLRLQIRNLQRLPLLAHRDEAGRERSRPHGSGGEAETTRVYPLDLVEKERKPMQFPNGSNIRVNMMYPTDFSYWEKLKAFVDYEPVESIAPEVRGILASVGIIKGVPFKPDAATKEALSKAVETAPKMIMAWRLAGRADGKDRYYTDRRYISAWAGTDNDWFRASYLDVNQRASFFQVAYSSAPAMVMDTINAGSKYPSTLWDKDGDLLDGSKSYKLHLPAGIPAKAFWAVTIYNPADGTMPETSQPFPSRNQMDKVPPNADGSIDLYFSPNKMEGVHEKNWIQTLHGRAFLVTIRLYGTGTEFYDQTWKPDDVVKLK